jgi:hypothetical protein
MNTLAIGTEIYNCGDMANIPHFGVIINIKTSKECGTQYEIKSEEEKPEKYWIDSCMISSRYLNNGLSRIVTKEAYIAWRKEALNKLMEAQS